MPARRALSEDELKFVTGGINNKNTLYSFIKTETTSDCIKRYYSGPTNLLACPNCSGGVTSMGQNASYHVYKCNKKCNGNKDVEIYIENDNKFI